MKSMESTLKRTWAVIDLDALKENYEKLRRHIGRGVKFLGVVKADAYGHGAIQVSRVLQESGAVVTEVSTDSRSIPAGSRLSREPRSISCPAWQICWA